MKVLLVNNLYGAQARGGAEFVVALEAQGLRRRNHDVAIVSAVPERNAPPPGVCIPGLAKSLCDTGIGYQKSEAGIEHYSYYPPNQYFYDDLAGKSWLSRVVWHWLDIFNWRSARQLEKILAVVQPDVVHTHNLMGLGFAVPNMVWRKQLRHVHTVHDVQLLHPSGLLPNDWRPRWPHEYAYLFLMRRLMGSPAVVIFPSEFAKRRHEQLGFFSKSTKVVLRNPAPVVKKSNRSIEDQHFVFVGQLEEHKGIIDLLDAWERWTDRGEARLTVIGDGALRSVVSERLAEMTQAEYVGAVFGAELNEYLDQASCLVVPSRVMENAPMVILQAMSRGVPVLAARSGGIPELVSENKTGWLFEPGDIAGLLNGLRVASSGSVDWSALAQAAREAVANQTEESHIDGLVSVYRG